MKAINNKICDAPQLKPLAELSSLTCSFLSHSPLFIFFSLLMLHKYPLPTISPQLVLCEPPCSSCHPELPSSTSTLFSKKIFSTRKYLLTCYNLFTSLFLSNSFLVNKQYVSTVQKHLGMQ